MTAHKGQTCRDQAADDTFHVIVLIEPWESWMAAECTLEVRDHTEKKVIPHHVESASSGVFRLSFDDTAEVKRVFESGNAEVRAIDQKGKTLGFRRIAKYRGRSSIALKLRIVRPSSDRAPVQLVGRSNAIISDATVYQLARNLARLQRVGFRSARAPRRVVQAIHELNHIAEVAAYSRTGGKLAEASLRTILSDSAFTSPSGPPGNAGAGGPGGGGVGGFGAGARATMLDQLGDLRAEFRCGSALSRATSVLDSAFILDLKERNVTARWTEQAHAYISNRMRDVSAYAGSVGRAPRGTGHPGGEFPSGGDDFTTPVLRPDQGGDLIPPDDPLGEGYGSDICAQIAEMCLALYRDVLTAQLRDAYTDLIAEVGPNNCLCSTYDPNQTFIARPQPSRLFDAPLPPGVFLHFRGQIITPILVTPNEIHFKIPANARTGFVYLRALGSLPSQASQRLANACGLAMPEIPSEILFDRSPAALISIIYPPVIDSLTSDVGQQPAEACTPVEIRWHTHLLDQPASAPIHPCGSIATILRDGQGNQIATGGASGSVLETRADTTTYTLEAVSRAGALECGTAAPISLTIIRVKYVRLERPAGIGTEHQGGTNGQLLVRISCPAPAGGQQVDLMSSDPAVLHVPSPVTIPERANSLLVDFATMAACTAAPIQVTAASAGHTAAGSLEYDIYTVPVLEWAAGPPAHVQEGGPFSSEVNASCVPDNSSRVNWWLIRTDPNNQQAPIALIAQRTSGQYPALRFRVELDSASARGLIPGNWELVVEIPDRANLRSQGLAFVVAQRPRFTMALTSPAERTVVWDEETEYTLVVTGENIRPNVNAPVVITAQGLPSAFQATPVNPVTFTQANSGQAQNTALRLLSAAAQGPIGVFQFRISASASGVQAPPAIPAVVNVKRQPGPFKVVERLYDSKTCSDSGRTISATVGGNGMDRTVTFAIPAPNRTINTTLPSIFYSMSPKCRVGVVIPPASGMTGPTGVKAVNLLNLGFEPGTGVRVALGDSIDNFQTFWQRFWFSSDDTLLVIIGRQPRGSTTATHFASLHDMITGQQLDSKPFSPAIVQTAEDPSPLLPPAWMTATAYAVDARVTYSALTYRCLVAHTSGVFEADLAAGKWVAEYLGETEIQLAVITGVVLTNQSNGDVVTVNYTNPNAVADSLTLHL